MKMPLKLVFENLPEVWPLISEGERKILAELMATICNEKASEQEKSKEVQLALGAERDQGVPKTVAIQSRWKAYGRADKHDGLTIAEIAELYGITPCAVRKHKLALEQIGSKRTGGRGRLSDLFSKSSVEALASSRGWAAKLVSNEQAEKLKQKLKDQAHGKSENLSS